MDLERALKDPFSDGENHGKHHRLKRVPPLLTYDCEIKVSPTFETCHGKQVHDMLLEIHMAMITSMCYVPCALGLLLSLFIFYYS